MSDKHPDPEVLAWLKSQPDPDLTDPDLTDPDLTDPDNPEWTEEDFARAVKVEDLPEREREMVYAAFPKTPRRRGPNKRPRKVLLSLRLDPEVLDRYRATGEGWQALINADLAEASKRHARAK